MRTLLLPLWLLVTVVVAAAVTDNSGGVVEDASTPPPSLDARAVTHFYSAYGTYQYFNHPDGHYQSYYAPPPSYGVPPPTPYPYVPPTQIDYPYWIAGPLPPAPPTPAVGGAPSYRYANYLYYGASRPPYVPLSSLTPYYDYYTQIDPPTVAPTSPPATVASTFPPTSPPLVTSVPCEPWNFTCWRALNVSLAENGYVVGSIAIGTVFVVSSALLLVAYCLARLLSSTNYLYVDNGGMGDTFYDSGIAAAADFSISGASPMARAVAARRGKFELPRPPRFVSMDIRSEYVHVAPDSGASIPMAAAPLSGARLRDVGASRWLPSSSSSPQFGSRVLNV